MDQTAAEQQGMRGLDELCEEYWGTAGMKGVNQEMKAATNKAVWMASTRSATNSDRQQEKQRTLKQGSGTPRRQGRMRRPNWRRATGKHEYRVLAGMQCAGASRVQGTSTLTGSATQTKKQEQNALTGLQRSRERANASTGLATHNGEATIEGVGRNATRRSNKETRGVGWIGGTTRRSRNQEGGHGSHWQSFQ